MPGYNFCGRFLHIVASFVRCIFSKQQTACGRLFHINFFKLVLCCRPVSPVGSLLLLKHYSLWNHQTFINFIRLYVISVNRFFFERCESMILGGMLFFLEKKKGGRRGFYFVWSSTDEVLQNRHEFHVRVMRASTFRYHQGRLDRFYFTSSVEFPILLKIAALESVLNHLSSNYLQCPHAISLEVGRKYHSMILSIRRLSSAKCLLSWWPLTVVFCRTCIWPKFRYQKGRWETRSICRSIISPSQPLFLLCSSVTTFRISTAFRMCWKGRYGHFVNTDDAESSLLEPKGV